MYSFPFYNSLSRNSKKLKTTCNGFIWRTFTYLHMHWKLNSCYSCTILFELIKRKNKKTNLFMRKNKLDKKIVLRARNNKNEFEYFHMFILSINSQKTLYYKLELLRNTTIIGSVSSNDVRFFENKVHYMVIPLVYNVERLSSPHKWAYSMLYWTRKSNP